MKSVAGWESSAVLVWNAMMQSERTVLVVDSSRIESATINRFEDQGYGIQRASNGAEALRYLQTGLRPDWIVLRVDGAQTDGWQVMAELTNNPELQSNPALVFSISGGSEVAVTSNGESNRPMARTQDARKSKSVILLVDDDADIRMAVSDVLQEEGFVVETAVNGRDALNVLQNGEKPGLILLDIMMPEMDGWQFMAEVMKHPELVSIPVVVFSAHASIRETATSVKAVGFIKKPFLMDELLKKVKYLSGVVS